MPQTLVAALLLCAAAAPVSACSVFALTAGDTVVVGANLDLEHDLEGLVFVNVRGVEKSVLPWKGHLPDDFEGGECVWVSLYGSVTFTCWGRDFIESGMNEAGLVVDQASLWAVYPPEDERPGVSCAQWMQYQLDNFATVDEVIAHLEDLRLDGEGWHFLVADATGARAIIEHTGGAPDVYTGSGAPYCAITNAPYAQVVGQLRNYAAFGGERDATAGDDSYARFARVAARLKDSEQPSGGGLVDFAFDILADVSVWDTQRSVVYDVTSGRVLWTSWRSEGLRWLDLSVLDFSEASPTLVTEVHGREAGDAARSLREYTPEANRANVAAAFLAQLDEDDRAALAARGTTPDAAAEFISVHPTSRQ